MEMRIIRTSVAASAVQATRELLRASLTRRGIRLLYMAGDAQAAIRAVEDDRPELILIDMELPGRDGAGLARALIASACPVRPEILLLRYAGFPVPGEAELRRDGVCLLDKPWTQADFDAALRALEHARARPERPERIAALMDELGVPACIGRSCLECAATLCARDGRLTYALSTELYPRVGEAFQMSAAQVERAMRRAIELASASGRIEQQYRIFSDTIDAGRGKPTCGEMIARLADILRMEG